MRTAYIVHNKLELLRSAIGICAFVEATDNAIFDDNQILPKKKEKSTRAGKENIHVYRYLRVAALASGSASEIPFRIASSISLTRLMRERQNDNDKSENSLNGLIVQTQ